MDVSALAVAFAFVAALGFASGNVLVRVGTQRVAAPTATFFTVLTGAILTLALAFAFNLSDIVSLPPQVLGWFALMGAMAYPIARLLNNTTITMIGAAPMLSFQPLIVLGLGLTFLGEEPGLLVVLGPPIIVGGLLLVFLAEGSNRSAQGIRQARSLGYLLALGSAKAIASRDVLSRYVVSGIAPPLVTAAFALAFGGGLLLVMTHRDVWNSFRSVPNRYIIICGLAGVCQGLAVASLFQALSRAPVTVVSPINACNPLLTVLLVHLFLRRLESVNFLLVLGTVLSVGGVVTVIIGAATG